MSGLSLVLIARDEERCIGRALDSAAPFVDELVVVDTGSTDSTVSVARSRGARVHHFAWCDDFAAAKNHALSLAGGEYRLVMDADEWIDGGGPELRQWVSIQMPRLGVVSCISSFDANGDQQCVTDDLVRVLPRGASFSGRVHEQVVGAYPITHTSLSLRHDGYLDQQLARKRGRNEALLTGVLAESPESGYHWYQLGCARASERRYVQACEAFSRALALVDEDSPQRHPLVVRTLHALGQAGRFADASALYEDQARRWAGSPDLHFVMADVLLELGAREPRRARAVLPLVRSLLTRCLEIGDRPDLPGAVHGRGSELARHNLDIVTGGHLGVTT